MGMSWTENAIKTVNPKTLNTEIPQQKAANAFRFAGTINRQKTAFVIRKQWHKQPPTAKPFVKKNARKAKKEKMEQVYVSRLDK